MPTPAKGYFLKDGTRVPSVTTILSRFKESGALMQWAFKQGQEGKAHLYEDAQKAAGIGTHVHAMVEQHIKSGEIIIPAGLDNDEQSKVESSFSAYLAWHENFKIKVVAQEIQLVSENWKFGGTPDAIAFVGNRLCLIDWKTSGGVYADYLVQLAAYKYLWEENNPEQKIDGGHHLLRFSKENGDFTHRYFPDLGQAWKQFELFRQAYEIDKELKKRAA